MTMKPEREILWGSLLYGSKFSKDWAEFSKINALPASRKDFERIVGCGQNDREFGLWFKKLLGLQVLEFVGEQSNGNGHTFRGYIVNGGKLFKYLKEDENTKILFPLYFKLFNRGRVI